MNGVTSIETLNINNYDTHGCVVLNDAKLLELIQLYPFLYNPRVRPFQDVDYDEWAWERITAAFNRSYESLEPNMLFSTELLKSRWDALQHVIKCVSDMTEIPEPLRTTLVKINVQLHDQTTDARSKNTSPAQKLIYENIEMVESLPLEQRKRLEAEVMELLLATELNAKATVKLNESDLIRVEDEYEQFLSAIQLKELFVLNTRPKDTQSDNVSGQATSDVMQLSEVLDVKEEAYKNPDNSKPTKAIHAWLENGIQQTFRQPLEHPPRWIALNEAKKYIRPCVVRLKRTIMEDDLPLAVIKRQPKW